MRAGWLGRRGCGLSSLGLPVLVAVLLAGACADVPGSGGQDGGTPADGGACQTAADCLATCTSKYCACFVGALGSLCVASCSLPADCPQGTTCDEAIGICTQAGLPSSSSSSSSGGPIACTNAADCKGHCPVGAKDCTCAQTPTGMHCVPTCTTNADCPPPLSCAPGKDLCVP